VTIPQIHAMFNGDRQRKQALVDHGFRLPSCAGQPAAEVRGVRVDRAAGDVRQRHPRPVRAEAHRRRDRRAGDPPTGLLDPEIEIKPADGQVQDLLEQCKDRDRPRRARALVTALTKRLCEDLTATSISRAEGALPAQRDRDARAAGDPADLRQGEFDVLVGVNLLREGLDLPEVSLVASSTPTRRASCAARRA
jgi:excinuclease ABC subunit B